MNENYLTISELSKKYGISETVIRNNVIKGRIPYSKRINDLKGVGGCKKKEIIVIDEEIFNIFILVFKFITKNSQEIFQKVALK